MTNPLIEDQLNEHYWVIGAEMGYGHQRAVNPFKSVAEGNIIMAGNNEHTSAFEKRLWRRYLRLYELFSRMKSFPVLGKSIFGMLDKLLHIPSLYPIRNLSAATFQVDALRSQLRKGLGQGVLKAISTKWLPVLTSFYVPALVADSAGHEPIYCIVCDADLNRVWVAKEPWDSRINYFAPCGKAALRLQSYGVPQERIFLTGFPLHDDLLGGRELKTLKHDLAIRLDVLDPNRRFHLAHGHSVQHFLGDSVQHLSADSVQHLSADSVRHVPADNVDEKPKRLLTVAFTVGGAGAQLELGLALVKSFKKRILNGEMRLLLIAGTRPDVRDAFQAAKIAAVGDHENLEVLFASNADDYYTLFDRAIRNTDILWTKPSELSFYCGLGLPIIIAPPIGSQEKFNRKWLLEVGAGMRQENPDHAGEWLFDMLDNGKFADMAWLGFLRARKLGLYHILDVLRTGQFLRSDHPLQR
ncbi:MAG: hypothetical protein SGJ05_08035 [bacterium]|nr:hypothetical protein [bacterium]